MKMPLRRAVPAGLVLLALAGGCREKTPPATADPAATSASASSAAPSTPSPAKLDEAVVTTNRVEIPRVAHDPVVLELPVVKTSRGAAIDDKVNALLSPENILGETLDDVRAEAKAVKTADDLAGGVQGSHYVVRYDQHALLEIEAFADYMGAYPSSNRFHVVVDVMTGDEVDEVAFRAEGSLALVKSLDARLQKEAKASAAAKDPDFNELLDGRHFELEDLRDFSISDAGLTFNYDYRFPHVALALEPPGRFFVPWSELGSAIEPKGPLARIHPVP